MKLSITGTQVVKGLMLLSGSEYGAEGRRAKKLKKQEEKVEEKRKRKG